MNILNELTEIKEKDIASTFKKQISSVEKAGLEVLIETCFSVQLDIPNIIEELALEHKTTSTYAKLVPTIPYTIDNYRLGYFSLTEQDSIVMACYDKHENERYYYIH